MRWESGTYGGWWNPYIKLILLLLDFLTDQLEYHNAGGCTDDDSTLPDGAIKAVGKGSLLTAICVGRDLVCLWTQDHVAMQSSKTPRMSKEVQQSWKRGKESSLYHFTLNMKWALILVF